MADQKVREMEPVETQIVEIMPPDVENLIYVVRNKQVMVDSDLAMLYQVETGALNRAVKRNIARFPEDFRFQLTKDEYENLKCQFGTSNGSGTENGYGGRRTLPYVFTEQGISMLASVLHSDVAINVSIGNRMATEIDLALMYLETAPTERPAQAATSRIVEAIITPPFLM